MTNTMTYKGYTADMVFDAEDKVIVGRVIDIDDIIAFHGESIAEFEASFHAGSMTTLPLPKNWARPPKSPRAANSCCASHPRFMPRR